MKNKNFILISTLIITSQFITAQTEDYRLSLGLSQIRNEYSGDYGNGIFNFKQRMFYGVGLNAGYYLTPSYDVGLQTSYGEYGYTEDPVNRFLGRKFDMTIFTHYKINNGYFMSEDSKIAPFVVFGLGFAAYGIDPGNDKSGVNPALSPLIITKGIDVIVPLGLGVKFQVTNQFAIQYQYLYYFTNSDVHDQNRSGGVVNTVFGTPLHPYSKSGNDAFGQFLFSLIFSLDPTGHQNNE